jgi:hypothetical protein
MKECPKCNNEHSKSGVYCSRRCANSRTFTEESRRRKSIANKKYWASLSEEQIVAKMATLRAASPCSPHNYLESLLTQDWDVIGIQGKRLRVILDQDGKCNKCGLDEWLGEQLTLEYEHIDGNNQNNSRDNVEALCPNCHSQTSTWRGRNIKSKRNNQRRTERYLKMKKH